MDINETVMNGIYAGWLGKIIGIRLGAVIEGDTYEDIKKEYGEVKGYLTSYKNFAADDDSNGPLFFVRALDGIEGTGLTQQDVAHTILNYVPYEHSFFWWGGYGISTEHTAYSNLYAGVPAHLSGSILKNGATVAEQIGGQIFIDSWGLVCPGNPDLAAKYADIVASVTHDGNGKYGGIFIAACISTAFIESDIKKIIQKGLSYLPKESEYVRMVNSVLNYYEGEPTDWRKAFVYVKDHFGYDRYPGNCHIIPNSAVIILSMLYGKGKFDDTLLIGTMCGWDTDCNVGNLGAIMGVLCGTEGISYKKWRQDINDLLINSSVMGSLNIMDIPYGAAYFAKIACKLNQQNPPGIWEKIFKDQGEWCHFEYPGSTHAMRTRIENSDCRVSLFQSYEKAYSGIGSLKVVLSGCETKEKVSIFKKTYYFPEDFSDSRYNPAFSPRAYPGQKISCQIIADQNSGNICARLYAKDGYSNSCLFSEKVCVGEKDWYTLTFDIPWSGQDTLIEEVGLQLLEIENTQGTVVYIDDLRIEGRAYYRMDFNEEKIENWPGTLRSEISQFTRHKGIGFIAEDGLHLSGTDVALMISGDYRWENYSVKAKLKPVLGEKHLINVRVRGAVEFYAVGLVGKNQMGIYKCNEEYQLVKTCNFKWEYGKEYEFIVNAEGKEITVVQDEVKVLTWEDEDKPYLTGAIGVSCLSNGHTVYEYLEVS